MGNLFVSSYEKSSILPLHLEESICITSTLSQTEAFRKNVGNLAYLVCVSVAKCIVTEWECKCNCKYGLWINRTHKYHNHSIGTSISDRIIVLECAVPKRITLWERVLMLEWVITQNTTTENACRNNVGIRNMWNA